MNRVVAAEVTRRNDMSSGLGPPRHLGGYNAGEVHDARQKNEEALHERASVLDCGDKRSAVTALASELIITLRPSRSKAATTPPPPVAAVQNLAAVHGSLHELAASLPRRSRREGDSFFFLGTRWDSQWRRPCLECGALLERKDGLSATEVG